MFLKSKLLGEIPGIVHGFGDALEPLPAPFISSWDLRPKAKQVHSVAFAWVSEKSQHCGEADGFVSRVCGLPVSVITADCVPILLAREDGRAVAAVHAGWRGTRAGIIRNVLNGLKEHGEDLGHWMAAIGPCARDCCYEVSPEMEEDFRRSFGHYNHSIILPRPRHLNLAELNGLEMRNLGLKKIDVLPYCTICSNNPAFFSFRRNKDTGRQYSVIQIT